MIYQIGPYTVMLLGLIGFLLVARKNKLGFIAYIVKGIIFTAYSIWVAQYGYALIEPIFIGISIKAYGDWKKDEKSQWHKV